MIYRGMIHERCIDGSRQALDWLESPCVRSLYQARPVGWNDCHRHAGFCTVVEVERHYVSYA